VSTTGSHPGLPKNVKKQLAKDIQSAGGIHKFREEHPQTLAKICDKRPLLCGSRGEDVRRKIQNEVTKWSVCDREAHLEKVLLRCKVQTNKSRGSLKKDDSDLDLDDSASEGLGDTGKREEEEEIEQEEEEQQQVAEGSQPPSQMSFPQPEPEPKPEFDVPNDMSVNAKEAVDITENKGLHFVVDCADVEFPFLL